jgi:hypothetical protein
VPRRWGEKRSEEDAMKAVEIAAEWVSVGDWVKTPDGFRFVLNVEYCDDGVHLSFTPASEGVRVFWYDEMVKVAS